MKLKKSEKANLEKKRVLFFQVGFIVSISLALIAFEWSTPMNDEIIELPKSKGKSEIELPPIIHPPKPKLLPLPQMVETWQIIKNKEEPEEDFTFVDEDEIPNLLEEFNIDLLEEKNEKDDIYVVCQSMPTFNEGDLTNFRDYVNKMIKYPRDAEKEGIQGKVRVQFVVNTKGEIININVIKSTHTFFSKEVIRVLEESPNWEPGMQSGKPVSIIFTMPIKFELRH